ncbi:MAG TPA: SAM-dependent methyltransferase [Thermoanaerobaculia bacterium]|nr:SAM-dependent methyltransferase [Thermoanaerobaculia bacterium]
MGADEPDEQTILEAAGDLFDLTQPDPSPADRLRDRIRTAGPIPFAVFMDEALYGDGGYYRRDDLPIGEEGDFVTGSSFSPLFGRATARLLRRLDAALGRPADFLEAGAGTGAHLANVAATLLDRGTADRETATGRRLLGWDRISRPLSESVSRVTDLKEIENGGIIGMIFSYELFDALPVHRLIGREAGLGEVWVDLDDTGAFTWREDELSDPSLAGLLGGATLQPGQVADLAPGWRPLYAELARRLGRGLLVTCDYGYQRDRLLDARVRRHGTLAAYTRQRVHRNPFVKIAEQDLTAHVDLTALLEAGEAEGLTTLALTRQSFWLAACGLFTDLQDAPLEQRRAAMALLDGEGMGEDIRVLVQARGVTAEGLFDVELPAG